MHEQAECLRPEAPNWNLRFSDDLEKLYRADRESRALSSRIALGVLAALMVVMTPAYDLMTRPPPEFNVIARQIQFCVELPAVLVALLFILLPRLRRYSVPLLLLAATVMSAGLIAQRSLGLEYGFEVPQTFVAVVVAAVAVLGGLRFWILVGWSTVVVVAGCAVEICIDGASGRSIYSSVTMGMLWSLLMAGAYALERAERANWLDRRRLNELACQDGLTGLNNRRHFDDLLQRLLREAARERKTVALLLIDIDRFKSYNDLYGHPTGDDCLRRIAGWLAQGTRRPQDFCARLGGEEFAAVWFNPMPPDALRLAEDLLSGIGQLGIAHGSSGAGGVVTASGGLAQISAPSPEQSVVTLAADLMRRADRALYAAKSQGRDRLVVADES